MTAKAGVRLVGHPPERRFKFGDLCDIERADFYPYILIVSLEIVGDGLGLGVRYDWMFHRFLFQVPAISFCVERRFFTRQPSNQPRTLIFAPCPNEIGCPQIKSGVGLPFQSMALDTGLLE